MSLLDRFGNEGLNVNYYSGIDYSGAPGEAIFINSNLISTEPASVSRRRRPSLRGRQGPRRQSPARRMLQ